MIALQTHVVTVELVLTLSTISSAYVQKDLPGKCVNHVSLVYYRIAAVIIFAF